LREALQRASDLLPAAAAGGLELEADMLMIFDDFSPCFFLIFDDP
jgi:hypothetical protein